MSTAQAERDVADFNERCPVGAAVTLRRDNGQVLETRVKYPAQVYDGRAVVWVDGIAGCYLLSRVRPAGEPPAELPEDLVRRSPAPGDRPYRRADDWPVQRGILEGAVPEYYSEARRIYGDTLPDVLEIGDLWDNRTAAENAVWLVNHLAGLLGQLRLMVEGHAARYHAESWDGLTERRVGERRGSLTDRRREDRVWLGGGVRQIEEADASRES